MGADLDHAHADFDREDDYVNADIDHKDGYVGFDLDYMAPDIGYIGTDSGHVVDYVNTDFEYVNADVAHYNDYVGENFYHGNGYVDLDVNMIHEAHKTLDNLKRAYNCEVVHGFDLKNVGHSFAFQHLERN